MMKKYLLLLLSIGAVSGWVHAQEKFPKHYTQAEKIETLSRIWSELKYNFVYADRLPFSQDSLYAAHIPQVLATRDDVAFFDLLKRYMARFGDGHTQVVRYSYNWNDVYDYAPLMVEELGGKYYLSEIWESSGLDSTALGAEIVRIEGIPTGEYVETHYFPYLAAGFEAAKYRLAANEIGTGLPGSKFRAELLYRDGRSCSVQIDNNYNLLNRERRLGKSWAWKGIRTPSRRVATFDWLEGKIAKLDIRSFDERMIPAVDSLLTVIGSRAEGLILDLRYCPGGSSVVGDSLAARLIDADYLLTGGSRTRINNAYYRSQGNWRAELSDFYTDKAYETIPSDTLRINRSRVLKCPVVILTGPMTASAAETFLIRIYEMPERPLILGQQSAGTTGAPLVLDLPHNACVRICTRCQLFPISGWPFVNESIRPDIEIVPEADDFMTGYDRVLQSALDILKK